MDQNRTKRKPKYLKSNKYKKQIKKSDKILRPWKENNSVGIKSVFRSGHSYGVNPDPFPARLVCRLKFADDGLLTSNGSLPNTCGNEIVYRLNSIYDPYYAVGGTTVVGYSTMATLYQRYIVTGALVEVDFYDPTNDAGVCAISINQTTPIQNLDVKALGEHSLTWTDIINNTGSQKKTFRLYVKPWTLAGVSKLEWLANKSGYSATMATNPVDEQYLRIAYANYLTGNSIKYAIRIIYYTELFDRKQLTSTSF